MQESNLDRLIDIVRQKLNQKMQEAQHLSPTLNDIYDIFNDLGIKIDRTEENTNQIIKALKNFSNKRDDKEMILHCLQLYISQSQHN